METDWLTFIESSQPILPRVGKSHQVYNAYNKKLNIHDYLWLRPPGTGTTGLIVRIKGRF
ncbi:MAG: hypothetical protein RIM23_00935 [Coleofasciculus sp. G3-WIS-01]|uniref:hypothetical protein n=1 Tax=Coleofasciculus sp. G3-WIS-01 TaxID=3069528 RepID=UPI0032F51576